MSVAELTAISEQGFAKRRQDYPKFQQSIAKITAPYSREISQLYRDGYVILPHFLSKPRCQQWIDQFNDLAQSAENLQCPVRADTSQVVKKLNSDYSITQQRLEKEFFLQGESCYQEWISMLQLQDPLLKLSNLIEVITDEKLLAIAAGYLNCLPALGFLKYRRSYANAIPRTDTQLFHRDGNSLRMVKCFLVLSTVPDEQSAHAYVKGSHRLPLTDADLLARYSSEEIKRKLPKETIVYHQANVGDIILEDTTGFHCGGKPSAVHQLLCLYSYVAHPEYGVKGAAVKVEKDLLKPLESHLQPVFDFVEFV